MEVVLGEAGLRTLGDKSSDPVSLPLSMSLGSSRFFLPVAPGLLVLRASGPR